MNFWKNHGTKILGVLTTLNALAVALLGISDLVPPQYTKYVLGFAAVTGTLGTSTFLRGFTNSAALKSE
jgi:hypothetical protein